LHRSVMNFFPDKNFFIPPQHSGIRRDEGLLRHHNDCVDRTLFLLESGARSDTKNWFV
jgi:hypothetical protein